jgi:lysophospholipase L1-like esterase
LNWLIGFGGLGCLASEPKSASDTGADSAWDDAKSIQENCFPHVASNLESMASYDRFAPTVGRHCAGTNHQTIEGVEKVVFLGDSITAGTWPTPEADYYRHLLTDQLTERFGDLEVVNCSEYGARTDDFLEHADRQITACFPELLDGSDVEDKRTLVLWTMGGNDLLALGNRASAGEESSVLLGRIDQVVEYQRAAISFFQDQQETLFPAGVDVVFTNNYEYTDGTGNFGSCPTADTFGFNFEVSSWALGYLTINEAYMQLAVDTQTDMVFMMEHFCGHGFYNEDPENGCFVPESERYFDPSCIHPTPEGHSALAELFDRVIGGTGP